MSQNNKIHKTNDFSLKGKVLNLPKIDLHRHLSGSIRTSTAKDIILKYNIKIEKENFSIDNLEDHITLTEPVSNGLKSYLKPFKILSKLFVNQEETSRIAFEAVEDAFKDNVVYLELRTSPKGFSPNDTLSLNEFIKGIYDGIKKAEDIYPITAKIIISFNRQVLHKSTREREEYFNKVIFLAYEFRDKLIVGFDLAGYERNIPPTWYRDFFCYINKLNFGITIHAGEFFEKEYIDSSISELHATRIGHGLSAANDTSLLEKLKNKNIVIESCITSNIISTAVKNIGLHPVNKFYESGINVVLCADNPKVHKISLSDEYINFLESFSYQITDIKHMIFNSLHSMFCDANTKIKVKKIIINHFNNI